MLKSFLAAVLLSASVERFFVSRMRDFFLPRSVLAQNSCVLFSPGTPLFCNYLAAKQPDWAFWQQSEARLGPRRASRGSSTCILAGYWLAGWLAAKWVAEIN